MKKTRIVWRQNPVIYVALLRGINVGGNNKINMKQLKNSFENTGMDNVVTYINTGNVIFENHNLKRNEMVQALEKVILEDFDLEIRVIVRSLEEIQKIIDSIPKNWKNDQKMRSDVMFLWEEVDHPEVLDELIIKPEIDTVKYIPGAILWSYEKINKNKSGMGKIIGTKIYKKMTVRNVNTTRKIYDLMKEHG